MIAAFILGLAIQAPARFDMVDIPAGYKSVGVPYLTDAGDVVVPAITTNAPNGRNRGLILDWKRGQTAAELHPELSNMSLCDVSADGTWLGMNYEGLYRGNIDKSEAKAILKLSLGSRVTYAQFSPSKEIAYLLDTNMNVPSGFAQHLVCRQINGTELTLNLGATHHKLIAFTSDGSVLLNDGDKVLIARQGKSPELAKGLDGYFVAQRWTAGADAVVYGVVRKASAPSNVIGLKWDLKADQLSWLDPPGPALSRPTPMGLFVGEVYNRSKGYGDLAVLQFGKPPSPLGDFGEPKSWTTTVLAMNAKGQILIEDGNTQKLGLFTPGVKGTFNQ